MIEKIEARIKEIETALQNCQAQHAQLVGHLAEAKNFLVMSEQPESSEAPAVEVPAE